MDAVCDFKIQTEARSCLKTFLRIFFGVSLFFKNMFWHLLEMSFYIVFFFISSVSCQMFFWLLGGEIRNSPLLPPSGCQQVEWRAAPSAGDEVFNDIMLFYKS